MSETLNEWVKGAEVYRGKRASTKWAARTAKERCPILLKWQHSNVLFSLPR